MEKENKKNQELIALAEEIRQALKKEDFTVIEAGLRQ